MRIVSLVPSWTEYIVDLGLGHSLVGRTKFCVRAPGYLDSSSIVGGTKQFHVDRVRQLRPDFIIASKEENTKELIEACESFAQVILTDVRSVLQAFDAMEFLADTLGCSSAGKEWRSKTEKTWGEPKQTIARAVYAIWQNPLMVAGHDTFISDVMRWWGIENAVPSDTTERYPTGNPEEWKAFNANGLLLSSEPFPFQEHHRALFEAQGLPSFMVDGEAFSWYGTRMYHASNEFNRVRQALSEMA